MNAYRKGVRLSLTVSPQVSDMLDELLSTGLFGLNRAKVAQRLLDRALLADDVERFAPKAQAARLQSLKLMQRDMQRLNDVMPPFPSMRRFAIESLPSPRYTGQEQVNLRKPKKRKGR